jgi:hypothetical protein
MPEDTLSYLGLDGLQRVREARRRVVELAAEQLGSVVDPSLRMRWDYDEALRALQAVEAEIRKRAALL